MTHNLILSKQCYRWCFERIYYCSGSAKLDHKLRVIQDYAERELRQDSEKDPCLIEGWDVERLTKIIAKQPNVVAIAKNGWGTQPCHRF